VEVVAEVLVAAEVALAALDYLIVLVQYRHQQCHLW
jgi:hypothetical protein